jgi:peptidoglycan/xylan/chitin deacetylase (PgdA/CDA1 family)
MIALRQSLLNGISSTFRACRLMPTVRSLLGIRGVILAFHEIHENPNRELMTGSTTTFLDHALAWLKNNGWEIVSLDEGLRRLMQDDSGRFAVLTFDDGYRDNLRNALPILEGHDTPFTLFVPTSALTRTLYSWWLGLRALFQMRDSVTIDAMERRFDCANFTSKAAALANVIRWVHYDLRRAQMLAPTFAAAGISLSTLNDSYFLDEDELKALARHRLASVGAHTSSHAALSSLDAASVRCEMFDNRSYLEQLLERPIKHFAYPYGGKAACGEREETIAAEVGFLSALTTRSSPLTVAHRRRPLFLPRIGFPAKETTTGLDGRVSGLQMAMSRLIHTRKRSCDT